VKIRIERDALADAVNWTGRALGNPRVGGNMGIGIDAKDDKVTFTSNDRDSSARAVIDGVIEEAGSCVIPGRLLVDITKTLPAAPVVITLNGTSIDVECGRSAFSLPTITTDFPKMVDLPTVLGSISGSDLANSVAQVYIAAETNESLASLTGIQMEFSSTTITLAATDRFRLALRDVDWTPASNDAESVALVPAFRLNDFAKGLADSNRVEISVANSGDNTSIGFTGGSFSITTQLLGYQFPRYRDTIPAPGNITAYVDTNALSSALKRVRLVLEDKERSWVSMTLGSGELKLTGEGKSNALASEAIDADVEGDIGGEIRFDPNRFIEGLAAVNAPFVKLSFINSNKPVLITGAKESGKDLDGGYKYWLMPKPARS